MSTISDGEYEFDFFDDGPVKINLNKTSKSGQKQSRRKVKKFDLKKKFVKKNEAKNKDIKNKGKVKDVVPRRTIPVIVKNNDEQATKKFKEESRGEGDENPFDEGYLKESKRIEPVKVEPRKETGIAEKKSVQEKKSKKKLRLFKFGKKKKEQKNNDSEKVKSETDVSYDYQGRFTEPKKRNLLSRIILQERLNGESFDYIESEYDHLTQEEVNASKNASKRRDRRLYKEVQAYEDATDDVTARKGWIAFKAGLLAVLLVGTVTMASHTIKDFKDQLIPQSQTEMLQDDYNKYRDSIDSFIEEVKEEQGYEFLSLTDEEILDAYVKMLKHEKGMHENQFKGALFKDQELLDRIVHRVYENEYSSFSEEELRDYRQLAYSMLSVAKPALFDDSNNYIRNPIVCDTVEARNSAKAKGYKMGLYSNTDDGIHVRNVGRIITSLRLLDESDYIEASKVNEGQNFLEQIVKDALGDEYQETNKEDLRDYKQLVYEMLPDEVKNEYIKDPIDIELRYKGYEIGE